MSKQKWDASHIADQSGRIAIVTGASSGIGFETARVLAEKGATVVVAVRNAEKGEKAIATIRERHADADLHLILLDLASLRSIRDFADQIKAEFPKLDLLINNAGVMMPPYSKTEDGFELQIGTNHFGHFALTGLLLEHLRKASGSRIVTVSSNMHKRGRLDLDDINWEKRSYNTMQAYSDSKIANLHFTRALAQRLENGSAGPIATAAHPGWTATELQRHVGLFAFLNRFFAQDITMGALPTLQAAIDGEAANGDYFGPSGFLEMKGYPEKVKTIERAKDDAIAERLWQMSEELTGVVVDKKGETTGA